MNYQNQKINFYQKRSFGENLTATFDFLKGNWKPILKLCLYILLPLSVVQGAFMNNICSAVVDSTMNPPTTVASFEGYAPTIIINYILLIIFYLVGQTVLTAIVYTVMQKYRTSETLEKYPLSEIKSDFISCLKQCFILTFYVMLIAIGYAVIVGTLGFIFSYLIFFIILGTIPLIVPFILIYPAYIFGEGTGTNNALRQAYRLGFPTWGSLFLLLLVLGIIGGVIHTVTFLPWYFAFIVKSVLTYSKTSVEVTNSMGTDFLMYLLAAIQAFGAFLAGVFVFVGVAFHYFSAAEAKDSVSVNDDIDNFEQL